MEYQDDIIYIRQRNQGLSIARNTGLQNASGKYIQFVDGDDCLIQVGYEHCLDLLRYHNPDIVHFTSSNKTFDKEVPYQYSEPISGSAYLYNNNLRAQKSLDSLKQLSSPNAKVMRDGVKIEIPSREIVPGDILLLEAGDMVVYWGE